MLDIATAPLRRYLQFEFSMVSGIVQPVMNTKKQGHTLIELLLSLAISLMLIGGVITVYLAHCKIMRIQSAFIHLQQNSRVISSIIKSDLQLGGYSQMNRYRINNTIFYRQDDHGRFQAIAEDVGQMNASYDRLDNKMISGVSVVLDLMDSTITQREYLYVAL